jgi:hypothetical protein
LQKSKEPSEDSNICQAILTNKVFNMIEKDEEKKLLKSQSSSYDPNFNDEEKSSNTLKEPTSFGDN